VGYESPDPFSREFIPHVIALLQDFLLVTLVIMLPRAVRMLAELLGLPSAVRAIVQ
jgi:hypothetical protein